MRSRYLSPTRPPQMSLLAALSVTALAGNMVFVGSVVALAFLRPDLGLAVHFVSEYALGRDGVVMEVAFAALAIGGFALAAALVLAGRRGVGPRVGFRDVPVLLWAGGAAVAGIWRTDPAGTARRDATPHGTIHNLAAGLAFLAVLIAMFTISAQWQRLPLWSALARPGMLIAASAVAALAWFFSPLAPGIGQRAFLTLAVGWLVLAAGHLVVLSWHSHPSRPVRPIVRLPRSRSRADHRAGG